MRPDSPEGGGYAAREGAVECRARQLELEVERRRRAERELAAARAELSARRAIDMSSVEQSQALLAAIVASSDDAIISKSVDGAIRSWNASAQRLFGYTPEEAIGRSITLIIPQDRLQEEAEILSRLHRGERIEHYETVRVAKDGRGIDVSLTISPLRDRSGNLIGASKIARDVTERKAIDAALCESQERFAAFMRSLPGLAWIKDADGRYVFANEAVEGAFGLALERLYGKTDDEIFGPETAAPFKVNDREALTSGTGVQVIESLEQADGVHHSVVSRFPISGTGTYIGGMAIDITDRIRAESALREADHRKDEFVATLAHELRNPLAPIQNSLHILRMAGQSHAVADRIHSVLERQVAQMVRLVDDLLEISRVSLGRIVLKTELVELNGVINDALEASLPFIEGGDLVCDVRLSDSRVLLKADPVRLAQAFSNILNNAARYTDKGGAIEIRVTLEGSQVCVAVRDTGAGIAPEMLPRLFEMFSQGESGRRHGGLGIGLSLVRTLVELHDGTITAYSAGRGHGSEFVVRLPVAEPAEGHEAQTRLAAQAQQGERETPLRPRHRILVVDDNKDSADSLEAILRLQGDCVKVVYDGPSALDAIASFEPTVVLMDLGMPGMDGCEVAQRLRARPETRNLRLIAMTGWGQQEDRRRSRDAGFDHHLVKPVDLDTLQGLLADD